MSIKARVLLFALLLELLGYSILIFYNHQYTKQALTQTHQRQIKELFYHNLAKINALTDTMEHNVRLMAIVGENLWQLKQQHPDMNLVPQFQNFLQQNFAHLPESIGGGIWYEPYRYDKHKRYFGPYVYRQQQKIIFTWELNTPEYDYHRQDWYLHALPLNWTRQQARAKQFYWTKPYYDEAGSKALMITVDGFMYDTQRHIIGLSTVDWALKEITDFIDKVKLTPNSYPFLIDTQSNQFISYPKNHSAVMQNIDLFDWTTRLRNHPQTPETKTTTIRSYKVNIDNKPYNVYYALSDIGMIFGLLIPKKDITLEIDAISAKNLKVGMFISLFFILSMLLLLQVLFSPLQEILEAILNSVRSDENQCLNITRISLQNHHEFKDIIQALNTVYQRIDDYTTELNLANQSLEEKQKKIKDLNQILQARINELEIERKKADQANKTKSNFLANMSHELRTPLHTIIGYCGLLEEEMQELNGASYQEDLMRIQAAANHLLMIISDILDLSKIEAGKITLQWENISLYPLIQHTVDTIKPLLEKQGNTLEVNYHVKDNFYTDSTKLYQILLNLLSNSCKFTHQGKIIFSIEQDKNDYYFKIQDSGIGIDPQKIIELFQPFTQADHSKTRKYEGTGLGLTITQHLCRMMQGDIYVESELGKGALFIVKLPILSPDSGLEKARKTNKDE